MLKLTKRPKLRAKDISHRHSLGGSGAAEDAVAHFYGQASSRSPSRFLTPGIPEYVPQPRDRPLMVTLTLGSHRLVVPGSSQMSVDALREIAGSMAGLPSSSLHLVSGEAPLRLGRVLGDYSALFGPYGLAVQVVTTVAPEERGSLPERGVGRLERPPLVGEIASLNGTVSWAWPGDSPRPESRVPPLVFQRQPVVPAETSYLIFLLYENGYSETEVVWPTLSVRQLRSKVGERTSLDPDSVFFAYEGDLLEVTRLMHDSPIIGEGASLHVFLSIGRALQFKLGWNAAQDSQGGGPPPTTPPTMLSAPASRFTTVGYTDASLGTNGTRGPSRHVPADPPSPAPTNRTSTSDKLRASFKCPKFMGEVRHWKVWNQGFVRFLSINRLDHVIEEGFLQANLHVSLQEDNKLVYYILEDAVSGSTVASKYVRRAAMWNGHEAYFFLYDGFALSGPAQAAILLGELGNFRFKVDETPSEVTLRLQELFDDLESIPGTAAMTMNDTQKINYLLSAIRPERSLASVYSQIQTEQVRGKITFVEACDDLRFRCEALRADDLLHAAVQPSKVRGLMASPDDSSVPGPAPASTTRALITTADKRQNRVAPVKKEPVPCTVKGCDTMTAAHLRLCKRSYGTLRVK